MMQVRTSLTRKNPQPLRGQLTPDRLIENLTPKSKT